MGRRRPINERFKRPIHQAAIKAGTQIRALGPAGKGTRRGLLHVLDNVCHATGKKPQDIRVLELGAGSGRLANALIKKEHIKPENYVLGDIVYGTHEAPALKKKVFLNAKKGKTKVLPMDVFGRPGEIGKFHVIAVPFVLGKPKWLKAMLDNYFEKLAPGGIMVVGSSQYSSAAIRQLTEKVARNPFMTAEQLSPQERETLALLNKIHELQQKGEIEPYTNPEQFFHSTALKEMPMLTFLIQKKSPTNH